MTSVNVYVVDDDASANYRLRWPAQAMIARGYDVALCRTGVEARDADVVVFNRPVRAVQADAVAELAATGRRVVVDVDDDYDHIASGHAAAGGDESRHLHAACRAATVVTVTTPALADLYGHGHGAVWPNHIPAWHLDAAASLRHDRPWVGWFGALQAHPHDLQTTQGQVGKAMADHDADLAFIGPPHQADYVARALRWRGRTRRLGWFTGQRALAAAIAAFDVGVVPLQDSLFNAAKSALKALQFAACGVPVVMAPTADNVRLHAAGIGLLARHPRDWYRHVGRLLAEPDLRAGLAEAGRRAAAAMTIEDHAPALHGIWTGEVGDAQRDRDVRRGRAAALLADR